METRQLRFAISLLVAMLTSNCFSANAQSIGVIRDACKLGNLSDEPASTTKSITEFIASLKANLRANDSKRLASMISYPLLVSPESGKFRVRTPNEFEKRYLQIFPMQLRDLVLRQGPECVSRVGAKGFTIRNGEIWFDLYPDGRVRIFTITTVVIPDE